VDGRAGREGGTDREERDRVNRMTLTDSEIECYSRQIIVPGIGAGGQEKLCTARVAVVGEEAGRRIAKLYARALGCSVVPAGASADVVIVAGCRDSDAGTSPSLAGAACPIVWYSLEGTRVVSGVVSPPDVLPPRTWPATHAATAEVMHAIAACDAVATAAALILGWEDCEREHAATLS
jgi:hypothetical protein